MIDKALPKQYSTNWKEVYAGGSQEEEAKLFATFSDRIKRVQEQIKKREHAPFQRRAFHAKIHAGIIDHAGIANAQFRVLPDIPQDLRIGFFQPLATYQATVRLSSASGAIQPMASAPLVISIEHVASSIKPAPTTAPAGQMIHRVLWFRS